MREGARQRRVGAARGARVTGGHRAHHVHLARSERLQGLLADVAAAPRRRAAGGDDAVGEARRPADTDRDRGHRAEAARDALIDYRRDAARGVQNLVDGSARCAASFDAGQGPVLIVGGRFTTAGGVQASNIASWDGATWSPLAGGGILGDHATVLAVDESGPGPVLYVGGTFGAAGNVSDCRSIARWDGS